MALILDTNALSAFADGDPALRRAIEDEPELAVPAVVLGEYLFGIRQSRLRAQYEAWLRQNSAVLPVLRIGPTTAARYAELHSLLKSAGRPIPSNDLWTAALAREHGYRIMSRDRHFESVPGVQLLSW
jgi:tRNA(fMet)-specific endonuclease VapC